MISFSHITIILIALSTGCSRADFTGLIPGQSSKTNSNNTHDGGQRPSSKTNSVTNDAAGLAPINPQSCSIKRFSDAMPPALEVQCPAGSAVYGHTGSGISQGVICCPLPAPDILTGDIERVKDISCRSDEVALGFNFQKAIICGRINKDRYKLDAPVNGPSSTCNYRSDGSVTNGGGDPNRCHVSSETAKVLMTKARDGSPEPVTNTCLPSQSSGLMTGLWSVQHGYSYHECSHFNASVLRFSDSGEAVQMLK